MDLKSIERTEPYVETRNRGHCGSSNMSNGYERVAKRICTLCYKQSSMYADAAAQMPLSCVPLEYAVDIPSTRIECYMPTLCNAIIQKFPAKNDDLP